MKAFIKALLSIEVLVAVGVGIGLLVSLGLWGAGACLFALAVEYHWPGWIVGVAAVIAFVPVGLVVAYIMGVQFLYMLKGW